MVYVFQLIDYYKIYGFFIIYYILNYLYLLSSKKYSTREMWHGRGHTLFI